MAKDKASEDSGNVKVCVRCRPISDKEKTQGCKLIVQIDKVRGTVSVQPPGSSPSEPPKIFTFDVVYASDAKQVDVYNETARPIVNSVLEGYNGTIFAYGQTGTGKTFTMEGVRSAPELRGIIPNSFAHIFGHIAEQKGDVKYLVRVSYLEIYNEDIRDLLGKDQLAKCEVKERPDVGVYVKDLSAFVVNNADDMDRIMSLGNKNRSVGATAMNAHSSRSHAIFTVTVECSEKMADGEWHLRMGKLHLVDLAGSERQTKTGATGERLKEATKINLSLSTLGNVISALVDGKSTHIPYRNSKLTRLLQDSLGGNSKTSMIANVGPVDYNYDETISTLRYANRAKNIKNKAKINEDPKDAMLREFQKEIERLRKQLAEAGGEAEDEGEDSEEEEEYEDEKGEKKMRKKKRTKKGGISPEKMAQMEKEIEEERQRLAEQKNMAEDEKVRVAKALKKREDELKKAQVKRNELQSKMAAIESRIIVGGVNLLEKAEEQQRLLAESQKEMEERLRKQEKLREKLKEKEQERVDIEEKYSSLQDEAAGKTKKLKKVWTLWMQAKSELSDVQVEHQREMEGLLENVRQLSRELRLNMLVIDQYIPPEYQNLIEQNVRWNEDIGEWQLKCVAYTGNNMRKQQPEKEKEKEVQGPDLSYMLMTYASGDGRDVVSSRGGAASVTSSTGSGRRSKKHGRGGGSSLYTQSATSDMADLDVLLQ